MTEIEVEKYKWNFDYKFMFMMSGGNKVGHSFLIKTLPRPLSVIICIKLHDFFGDATHNAHHGARLFNTPSSSVCDLQAVSSVGYRLVRDCTKKKPSLPINLLRVAVKSMFCVKPHNWCPGVHCDDSPYVLCWNCTLHYVPGR